MPNSQDKVHYMQYWPLYVHTYSTLSNLSVVFQCTQNKFVSCPEESKLNCFVIDCFGLKG